MGGSRGTPKVDPLFGIEIPGDSSTAAEQREALDRHLEAAQRHASSLVDPVGELPSSLQRCIDRVAALGPKGVLAHQKDALRMLRSRAAALKPLNHDLMSKCHPDVASVLRAASPGGLHVALIRRYLDLIDFCDKDLGDDLLNGFPFVGDIPVFPGAPLANVREPSISVEDLAKVEAPRISQELVRQQARPPVGSQALEDEAEIYSQTLMDVHLGRMSPLLPLSDAAASPPFTRRFAVRQTSSMGASKVRCIDDFAQSLINSSVRVSRRIRMGTVSELAAAGRVLSASTSRTGLSIVKSDFKAAYRSCPIRPSHNRLAGILVRDPSSGRVFYTRQLAMPFGAVSAVYAWDRLGEAFSAILREVFLIPVSRYVDDLFFVIFSDIARESRRILLDVIGLFGAVLSPEKTPRPSPQQVVLGVLARFSGADLLHLEIEPSRLQFWEEQVRRILLLPPRLAATEAEQLAGRLEFAASAVWGAMPRARFSSLYQLARLGTLPPDIGEDLAWVLALFHARPGRSVPLPADGYLTAVLYTDASGAPRNGLGSFLFIDGRYLWSSCSAPSDLLNALEARKTQINPLELCGVLAALWTFENLLMNRHVLVLVDNTTALGSLRSGRSRAEDMNELVFLSHSVASKCDILPSFFWVPSKLNWADAPSRGLPPRFGTRVDPVCRWDSVIRAISG